jgi:hypothetical protein
MDTADGVAVYMVTWLDWHMHVEVGQHKVVLLLFGVGCSQVSVSEAVVGVGAAKCQFLKLLLGLGAAPMSHDGSIGSVGEGKAHVTLRLLFLDCVHRRVD